MFFLGVGVRSRQPKEVPRAHLSPKKELTSFAVYIKLFSFVHTTTKTYHGVEGMQGCVSRVYHDGHPMRT
jgi:hypothetical protein